MEAYLAALDGDVETTIDKVSVLETELVASESVSMDTLKGTATVIVGSDKIQPLLKGRSNHILEVLRAKVEYPEAKARMITNVKDLDAKEVETTGAAYSVSDISTIMNAGEYITIALPEVMNIYEISGAAAPAENFKLQISLNGLSWEDVNFEVKDGALMTEEILTGAYVRLVCTTEGTEAAVTKLSVTKASEMRSAKVLTDLATYKTYTPSYAIDGSLETSFWSNSFATDGNYICVDLGRAAKLGSIEVYNGISKGNVDGFAEIRLETSIDGVFWKKVGEIQTADGYIDVDDTMKKLVFDARGEEAQYFRFVASGTSETWTKIFEIVYDAEFTEYENHVKVSTNMTAYDEAGYAADKAMDNSHATWFQSAGANVAGDYVSVDLGTLVPLYDASVYFAPTGTFANVKLQTSVDGVEWKDASEYMAEADYVTVENYSAARFGTSGELVRHIRFVAGEANESAVCVYEIKYNQTVEAQNYEPVLATSMTPYKNTFTVDKAMDGDMNTKFYSDAAQVKDDYVQVNLGCPVSLNDFAIWFAANPKKENTSDGFKEFQVQISLDGVTWTDAGSKVTNSEYKLVDGKYLATGDLGGKIGQYVRFKATAAYSSWLQIFEIEINKTLDFSGIRYVDDANTVNVNHSHQIADRDVSTGARIYDTETGKEFIYPMTTHRDVLNIAVLQNAQNINQAKASVQTLDGEWTEIGVFDKAWKVFEINNSILAFKLSFEGTMDVGMQEIIVYGGADYIKVVEALEKVPEDFSIYTEETVKAVTDAVEAVIYGKEAEKQAEVDAMAAAIENAVEALAEKEAEPMIPDSEVCKVFADIDHDIWYEDFVQYVYDKGIMSGNEGLFRPTENVTRAQVVTTLYNIEGKPEVSDYSAVDELSDVEAGKWYTDAVSWAYNAGITTGNSTTKMFEMHKSVTRQQLATFFYRYAEYKGLDIETREDISNLLGVDQVMPYALEHMQWAVGTGLVTGIQLSEPQEGFEYDLRPQGTATRQQMAAILQRFCEGNAL